MQATQQPLDALQVKLREALARQDWDAIVELDALCRAGVTALTESGAEASGQLEALLEVYAELQLAARQERERIAAELGRLNQGRQMSNAYQPLT